MRAVVVVAVSAAACSDDAPAPLFPADYPATFVELRSCRRSSDHDLNYVRVLADPAAAGPYASRAAQFPEGAIVLKEEHDFGDPSCTGGATQWTVMVRSASAADLGGWRWQKVDRDRAVVTEDEPRCWGCHQRCGVPPDGYEGTCAVP